jgi:hypothetical protein
VNINLVEPPTDHSTRIDFFREIASHHNNIVPNNEKPVPVKDIPVTTHILNEPSLITYIANDPIQDCVAIFVNLRNGRSQPTLHCIFTPGLISKFASPNKLASIIHSALQSRVPSLATTANTPPSILSTTASTRRIGRGGHNRTATSSFKSIPVHLSLTSTKNHKYHVIINGQGGHATANIYHTHYDESNLRSLIDGVPYSINRAYETYEEALECFKQYYNHITTQEEIDFMNANAPLEASNLNNPCSVIREQIGQYNRSNSNIKEHTWTNNTSDQTIGSLRHAASVRMEKLNLPPTASYDFFDQTFTPRSFTYPVRSLTLSLLLNHQSSPDCTTHHTTKSQDKTRRSHLQSPPALTTSTTSQTSTAP